jgi:signal transduction histidine kinase
MNLRLKLLVPLLVIAGLVGAYLYSVWLPRSLAEAQSDHLVRVQRHLDSVAEGLIPLLVSGQLDAIHENLSALKLRNRDWEDIRLTDQRGRQLYPLIGSAPTPPLRADAEKEVVARPIRFLDSELGSLKVLIDFSELHTRDREHHAEMGIILGLVTLLLVLTLGVALELSVGRPVHSLVLASRELARGNYAANLPPQRRDEVGALIGTFAAMRSELREHHEHLEELVAQRTTELKEKNASLESALTLVRRAQKELIESEKLASLGRLVAGFAHEINTPIGVAVGASSVALESSQKLQPLLQHEEVDEVVLRAHLGQIDEACRLVFSNLTRAADLVGRFKRTSVDQVRGAARLYDLKETLTDVVASLHDVVKRTPVKIRIDCAERINLYGYPGALGQIVTNLVINSLHHGFADGGQAGAIELSGARTGDEIVIEVRDNGKGMDAMTLSRIFEPFFTTARESGGTGLGLFICHNLATAELKGSLRCDSEPGRGTRIVLRYPAQSAPAAA